MKIQVDKHDVAAVADDVKITMTLQTTEGEVTVTSPDAAAGTPEIATEEIKAAQQAEVQRQAEEAAHTMALLAGAPQRVIVPLVGVSMNSLEMIPSNWTILPADGDNIEAYNNATGRRFVGTHVDFKQILRGK
jgi:hypothetical protein